MDLYQRFGVSFEDEEKEKDLYSRFGISFDEPAESAEEPSVAARPPVSEPVKRSRSRGNQQSAFSGSDLLETVQAFGSGMAGDTSFTPPESLRSFDEAIRAGTPSLEQVREVADYYTNDPRARERLNGEQRSELRRWLEAAETGNLEGLSPSSGILRETPQGAFDAGQKIGDAWRALGKPLEHLETAKDIGQSLMTRPYRMFDQERSLLPKLRETPEPTPREPVDAERLRDEMLAQDPFFKRTDRPLILDLLDRDDREEAHKSEMADKRTVGGWARTIGRGGAEGAAGAIGGAIQGKAIDLERVRQDMGFAPRPVEDSPMYKTGENINELGRRLADIKDEYRNHWLTDTVVGAGSMATYGGIGLLSRGGLGAYSRMTGKVPSKAAQAVAGYGPAVDMAQSSGVSQAYENVQEFREMYPELAAEMGIDDQWAVRFATGEDPRLYGAVQVGSMVSMLRPMTGPIRERTIRRMVETGINEFAVENLGAWGQNVLRQSYDKDHPLWEQVPYQGATAGLGAAFIALLFSPLTRRAPDGPTGGTRTPDTGNRFAAEAPGQWGDQTVQPDSDLARILQGLGDNGIDASVLYGNEADETGKPLDLNDIDGVIGWIGNNFSQSQEFTTSADQATVTGGLLASPQPFAQQTDPFAQAAQGDTTEHNPHKGAQPLDMQRLVASLQNRDRSRKNYLIQMDQIATNPDYNRLSVSRDSNTGAPMVFGVGRKVDKGINPAQIGRSDNVSMSDGKGGVVSIPVRYAVIEASQVRASHDAKGNRDLNYGFNGLTALNNGRTAGLQEAWRRKTTGAYLEALKADAESHGIAPEAIDALSTPVLVRLFEADSLAGIENPGAASNVSLAETLSASEQATTDARALSPETIASYRPFPIDSAANLDFIRMAARDLGSKGDLFMADGTLSAQGRKRVESALLARAFPDSTIITELTESLDPDIKSLGGTLLDVSGEWSQLRDSAQSGSVPAEFDITQNIIDAVHLVRKARQSGTPIRELLGQDDIFSGNVDPLTEAVVRIMYRGDALNRQRARDKISAMLLGYVRNAMQNVAGMGDMFGDRATPVQTLEAQRAEAEGQESGPQQGSLLAGRPNDLGSQGQQGSGADASGAEAEADVDETTVESDQQTESTETGERQPLIPGDWWKAPVDKLQDGWANTLIKARQAASQMAIESTGLSHEQLVDRVVASIFANDLLMGQKTSGLQLRRRYGELTGKKVEPGTIEVKRAEEAMEAAGILAARNIVLELGTGQRGRTNAEVYEKLLTLHDNMPKLGTRTSGSVARQAYSTPLPLAWVAQVLGGIHPGQTILEPTAGNGALLFGAVANSKSFANELDADRAKTLASIIDVKVSQKNAIEWEPGEKVDLVIANPPFGTVKQDGESKVFNVGGFETTEIDHAIVFKSLESMKDGGRAVFIIGSTMAQSEKGRTQGYRSANKIRFFRTLMDRYNVTDLFTVDGSLYAKQGASFPVDVIVIEGRGKSSLKTPGHTLPRVYTSYEQLGELVNGNLLEPRSGADGTRGSQTEAPAGGVEPDVPGTAGNQGGGDAGTGAGSQDGGTEAGAGTGPSGVPAGTDAQPGDSTVRPDRDESVPVDALQPEGDRSGAEGREPAGSETGVRGDQSGGVGGATVDAAIDTALDDAFGADTAIDTALDDVFGQETGGKLSGQKPGGKLSGTRTASQAAKSAAQNTKAAFEEAGQALNALFSAPGTLGSGPSFSEETYAKAKPHFVAMARHLGDAAVDMVDVAKAIVTALRDQFGMNREAVENMRPYLRKFLEDVREGVIDLAGEATGEATGEVQPKKAPRKKEEGTDRQVDYEPGSSVANVGTLVPVNLRDAIHGAVAAVKEANGDLDQYVANQLGIDVAKISDFFSAEQIDALALTFDNFSRGMGFVLGDQTGVGKGRVVAGVLLYAMRRGLKPIFVTEKPNLYADMFRDMTDIGMDQVRILMTNAPVKIPLNEEETAWLTTTNGKTHEADLRRMMQKGSIGDHDVIFTTYSQMQPVEKGEETFRNHFLRQFATDNVIVFDESHNAGGAGQASVQADGMNRAKFAREMVGIARNVLYSSATWAKRPDVMDLYSRTSMSLAVDNPEELISAILAGGVPLQQVVSSMLASDGQMIRRERSFKGVEYNTTSVEVDVQLAEQVAKVLNRVFVFDKAKRAAVNDLQADAAEAGSYIKEGGHVEVIAESINFASVMHNLIDQMLLSLKMEATLEQVREVMESGRKPVVTLSNTMGSFIKEYAEDHNLKPGDPINITFNDLLLRYLDKSREAKRQSVMKKKHGREDVDPDGWIRWTLTDDELGPRGVALYEETKALIESIDMSRMPVSPIDYLRAKIAEMGYRTTEITGRSEVIDYTGGASVYRKRPSKEVGPSGRLSSITKFNNGEFDVIILNQAGSTGLSLHASEKFEDQRQRVMIIAQPEKNVDTHMQMLGRVHRTGQVIVPEYRQLIANIPAEKRPAAVLAKKMASLNANTTASRGSDVTAEDVPDIMNQIGDEVAHSLMEQNPDLHDALGAPLDLGGSSEGAARKVTGRLPMLPVASQAQFYQDLESEYADTLERLEAMGESPLEAKTFDLDAKTIKSEVVREASGDSESPFAGNVVAEKVDMKRIGKPMTSAEVQATLDQYLKDTLSGFPDEMDLSGAKRPFPTLSPTEAAGRVYTNTLARETDADFSVYRTEVLDEIDTDTDKGRTRKKKMFEALREQENRFQRIIGSAPVGSSLILQTEQGPYRAVVGRIEKRGSPKNPLALGSWKMTFYIADAMRTITVPFSQLDTLDGQKMKISPQREMLDRALGHFDRAQSISREERWIMTGNLLAAYGMFPTGAILNFTDEKGEMRQGILMPKKWDLDKALDAKPFQFASPEHVVEFLNRQENGIVQTKDESFSIRNVRSRWDRSFRISVPKAKRIGGRWYLNEHIVNALQGREFVTSGKVMTVTVDPETARAIMQIVARSEPLITYSYKEDAKAASGVAEEGSLYSGYGRPRTVQAPRKRAETAPQLDLFSQEMRPADPVQAKKQDRDNFFALHHRVPTKTLKVGADRVTNQEEAAHVLSGIRKHSEEVFYALITDADGAILDVQLHSKGTHEASLVEPSIVVPAAASLPGATSVWFAHNHPSGTQKPSGADVSITRTLNKAFDGTPIRIKGHLIFGSEGVSVMDQDGDILDTGKKITPRLRKRTIPVTERMIKKRPRSDIPSITDPSQAEAFAASLESDNALILLNNQHQPVAILSMTLAEMQFVRRQAWSVRDDRGQGGGSSLRILNAISKSGAAAAIVKSKSKDAGHNMARYLSQTKVVQRTLDLIVMDKATGLYTSIGGMVSFDDHVPFMSRSNKLGLRRQISGIAKSLGSNLRVHEDVISAREETGVRIPSDARGFFYQGKVHVIADAHDNAFEVESTIWHEVFHAGIWNLFKGNLSAYYDAMHGIRDANANIQKAAAQWVKDFGKDFREDLAERGFTPEQVEVFTELRSIEEALADLSGATGAMVPLKGIREFVRKIIRWMRAQGWRSLPNFLEELSDAEAFAIITQAREAVSGSDESGAIAFDRSGNPTVLGLTPERVDKILKQEAVSHRPDTGRAYVAWINPKDFIPATTPSQYQQEVRKDVTDLDLSRLSEEVQTPFLYIERDKVLETGLEDGKFKFRITGHEGRHRMEAAANAGIRRMPVVLVRRDTDWTNTLEQKDEQYLYAEKHGSLGRGEKGAFVESMIPLVYNNRDQILAIFSNPHEVRFSVKRALEVARKKHGGFRTRSEEEFFGKFWPGVLKQAGLKRKPDMKSIRSAARRAVQDMAEWLQENPRFKDYYNADMAAVREVLDDSFGKISNEQFAFFQLVLGLTSPATRLAGNVGDAVAVFRLFVDQGNLSSIQMAKNHKGNLVIQSSPITLSGTTSANKGRSLLVMQRLANEKGSWKAAISFMQEQVSVSDLHKFNREMGYSGSVENIGHIRNLVRQATGQDETIPRMFIFGEKVGAYTLNTLGDHRYNTIDVWESRFIRSYFDGMFEQNTGLPESRAERDLFQRFTELFKEELEAYLGETVETSAAQAMRWFYMLAAAKEAGYAAAGTNKTISEYAAGAVQGVRAPYQGSGRQGDAEAARGNESEAPVGSPIFYSRGNPNSAVGRQQRGLASWVKNGQPIDRMFKFIFDPTGRLYDSAGRHRLGKAVAGQVSKTINERKFPKAMSWMNGPLEVARAGIIDRHGLDQDFVNREFVSQAEKATIIGIGEGFLKKLAKADIGAEEAKVLQGILAEGDVADADMQALSEPIRQAINDLGLQMVELGLLDRDTYHRHLGKYLHRSYFKYETAMHGLPKWMKRIGNRRRKAIYGQELRARGLKQELTTMRLLRDMPKDWWGRKLSPEDADKQLVNTEWMMLDLVKTPGEGSGSLEGMEAGGKPRTVRRVFWPADMPVPQRLAEYTNRGTFKVTDTKGRKLILRRDFTREEREKMGEILDARYNIVRTFSILANDIANGRFFKDIAENPEWAVMEAPEESKRLGRVGDASEANLSRLNTYSDLDWVRVPQTLVTGTKQAKWGALSGMYVRPAIWRDLNEMDKMSHEGSWASLLRQWKINKTARSPVVHMNNVMSNLILMDLIDVRMQDLVRGVVEYVKKGKDYEDARDHGAFGVGFAEKELKRNYLEPLLQDIIKEAENSRDDVTGRAHVLSKLLYGIYTTVKKADQKMVDLYGIEDEVFRMATYLRYRSQGASQMEAAQIARDQFLNYDIRAPWVNAARQTVLPFISYTYRAVPAVAAAIAHRPHKLAKYIVLGYLWNLMAYEIEPGDEEEERRTMRDPMQSMTWASIPGTDIGVHRMLRMPFRDEHGNPYFQDIYRWVPAGDVLDVSQGQLPILPAWAQPGGPLVMGAELVLNRSLFTGKDIVNWDTDTSGQATGKAFDYLWKAWMPSAAYIPGSWHYDKLAAAVRDERDMLGRAYSVPAALASGVGIKIQPHDVQLGYYFRGTEIQRNVQAIRSEIRQIEMDRARNIGSPESRSKRLEIAREKLNRLEQAQRELVGR